MTSNAHPDVPLKDLDLVSIQETRNLIQQAKAAFETLRTFSQERIDMIVEAMASAAESNAHQLAEMAVAETGIGRVTDKVQKNRFAARNVFQHIRSQKTVGIIRSDRATGIMEVAMPVGLICGIVPTTNPTSTVIFKSLIAVKAANPIIFSPHPNAKRCIWASSNIMHEAAVAAGAPRGLIACPQIPSMQASQELMTHPETALILATGGSDMVKAAYSSGKPALGVGPGNVPAYIHQSADVHEAVARILASKTFDNGTICSSEQAIVVDRAITAEVRQALIALNAHFLTEREATQLQNVLFTSRGTMTPSLVGRSCRTIADAAKITIPETTSVLIVEPAGIGPGFLLAHEKLSPVLGFFEVSGPDEACKTCLALLALGGIGHSMAIHCMDERVIEDFALNKPVSRLLVNTPSSLGGIGKTTNLTPSLTLGCGTIGGNATSDNITATHLINIKRVAYHAVESTHPTMAPAKPSRPTIRVDDVRSLVESVLKRSEQTPVIPPKSRPETTGY